MESGSDAGSAVWCTSLRSLLCAAEDMGWMAAVVVAGGVGDGPANGGCPECVCLLDRGLSVGVGLCARGEGKTDVSAGWGDKRRAAIVEPEAWQRPGRGLVEPAWC